MAWETRNDELGTGWTTALVLLALACVAVGVFFVPLAMAHTISRAPDLYYLDTGASRAAMATKPDNRRGEVHATGSRLTGTALPGMATTYIKLGMVDDGRIAGILVRVASKPRPEPDPTPTPDHTTVKKNYRWLTRARHALGPWLIWSLNTPRGGRPT
ncbi:hypothetical protein [Nocardioides sp.]|uniref:hypothetical protein n=1 Tax=Nocardioides sp. TaxID=35761 RepID=UPI002BFE36A2|nr:hypothetical protein [Nocardioides sp.]HXH80031.1 hypothetical protein [Nocardioides sp.]